MKDNEKVILKKENGIVIQVEELPKFVDENGKELPHLCIECSNASNCRKYLDVNLKEISEYPDIETGFSVTENGEVGRVKVIDCGGYKKADQKKKYTNAEKNALLESILLYHTDAEDLKEGWDTLADRLERQRERSKTRR